MVESTKTQYGIQIKEKMKRMVQNKLIRIIVVPLVLILVLAGGALFAKSGAQKTDRSTTKAQPSKEKALLTKGVKRSTQDMTNPEAETATSHQGQNASQSADTQATQPQGAGGQSGQSGSSSQPNQGQTGQTMPSQQSQSGGTSSSKTSPPPANQASKEVIHVTLSIDKGSGKHDYPLEVEKNSTVLQLLQKASSTYGFSMRFSENSAYGAFIEEIDGVSNNPSQGMYWLYYCNGKYANVGASSQRLSEGDVILWKYQSAR